MNGAITAVPGIKVGHATDLQGLTGCTVVLCEGGAVGGVDQRGGAPGTRETDLLRPMHLVQKVHATVLAGGSAFGLAAADGVMRYLAERRIGFRVGSVSPPTPAPTVSPPTGKGAQPGRAGKGVRVPIVPAAVLFDLAVGSSQAYPDAAMGYAACAAATDAPVTEGNVGAGTGCSAGKALGASLATKTGIGSASMELTPGLVVGALFAVNPLGDVVDAVGLGQIVAGARLPHGDGFADTLALLRTTSRSRFPGLRAGGRAGGNGTRSSESQASGATVIGVVATNARLTKEEANKVAQMAHDGLARAIRPAHTMFDGDTTFALATLDCVGQAGKVRASSMLVGAYAAEVTALAIVRAARTATALGGLPSGVEVSSAKGD